MTGIVNSTGAKSGIIGTTVGTPSGGKVLQVVQEVEIGIGATTSTGGWDDEIDSGVLFLDTTITPSATSSKIFVMVNLNIGISVSNIGAFWRIVRGSTPIYVPTAGGPTRQLTSAFPRSPSDGTIINSNAVYLDSPSTTSATTYKIEWRVQSGTAYLNRGGDNSDEVQIGRTASSMTLIEIGA